MRSGVSMHAPAATIPMAAAQFALPSVFAFRSSALAARAEPEDGTNQGASAPGCVLSVRG